MDFDFGLIALVLVVAKTILDYVAPKTKTTADDKARDAIGKAQQLLPAAKVMVEMKRTEPVKAPPASNSPSKPL
jgi:hypothetical protein